jgi:FAD/FMN-containing dehydrogenase
MAALNPQLLAALHAQLGAGAVDTGEAISPRHHADWSGHDPCAPLALLRPRDTAEVAACLKLCHEYSQAVVVQGGLTGLAGGATPRPGELALSLERLRGIEALDTGGATLIAGAGTPLETIHEAAAAQGLQFALDLAARGSCTIGGNISTNAGGIRVIRYGMAREQVLGLEAVLADGTVLSSMNTMLKNNAGYDLKQLFIGTEGTLGVITRAVLRLQPAPRERHTAMVAVADFERLVTLLGECRRSFGGELSSFEVMWSDYYEFAAGHVHSGARPFSEPHALYVLIELESFAAGEHGGRLESGLATLLERGVIQDGVVARSIEESNRLWRVRDAAGELMVHVPHALSYDISLPMPAMAAYLTKLQAEVAPFMGPLPPLLFGHLGDGNLHVLIGPRDLGVVPELNAIVYGALRGFGSVAAEHGIGVAKRDYLGNSRTSAEVALMRQLKAALDPKRILNPGRVI